MAFSKKISSLNGSINSTARVITSNPFAKVIICDCYHFHFRLSAEVLQGHVMRRTWIFSISFFYSPSVLGPMVHNLVKGSFSLAISTGIMPGFEDFLLVLCPTLYLGNRLVTKLWDASGMQVARNSGFYPKFQGRGSHLHRAGEHDHCLSVLKLADLTTTYHVYLTVSNLVGCLPEPDVLLSKRGTLPGSRTDQCAGCRPWQVSSKDPTPNTFHSSFQ